MRQPENNMETNKHDLAQAYVLGELSGAAAAEVESQAARDPELRQAIRELEDGVAASVRALPKQRVPGGCERAIEASIDQPTPVSAATAKSPHPIRWAVLGGIAALLVAGVSIGGYEWLRSRNESAVFVAELGVGRVQVRPLQLATPANNRDARFIQLASLAERLWDNPAQSGDSGLDGGYAVFDPATSQGFIAVREVPALRQQQRYHLWYVDRETGRLHDAGPLPLAQATRGMFFFSLPGADASRSAQPDFFLTIEDASATADGPPGRVVLGKPI